MDGTDPRSAELTVEAAGPSEPESAAGPRRRGLVAALAVVLLALLVTVGLLWRGVRAEDRRQDVRQQALAVATQEGVNLTSISYLTADRDLGRIVDRATGTLKSQFESQRAGFPAVLAKEKSVSAGRVLATAVASQDGDSAQVLVAVDATVTTTPAGGRSVSVVKHYRMNMRVQRVKGRWLVSQVAFAGVPQ